MKLALDVFVAAAVVVVVIGGVGGYRHCKSEYTIQIYLHCAYIFLQPIWSSTTCYQVDVCLAYSWRYVKLGAGCACVYVLKHILLNTKECKRQQTCLAAEGKHYRAHTHIKSYISVAFHVAISQEGDADEEEAEEGGACLSCYSALCVVALWLVFVS